MTTGRGDIRSSQGDSLMSGGATSEVPRGASPRVLELSGGADAPARARSWALSCLPEAPIGISSDDVALIVSELVTNSVVHAGVDESRQLTVTAASRPGGWRITVSDPGSDTVPRLRALDAATPGGLGLRIVERLCADWGTFRDAKRATHVWCDVPAGQPA